MITKTALPIQVEILTASKKLLSQVQMKGSLSNEDMDNMKIIGWVDGTAIDKDYPYQLMLIALDSKLYFVRISPSYFGTQMYKKWINENPQIFVV